jgi:RND family efflux transporter MFP subunit
MNVPEQRLVPAARSGTDADTIWAELASAEDAQRRCALWLRWLTELVPGCTAGVVLLDNGQGALAATARLPEGLSPQALAEVVQQAAELGVMAIRAMPQGHELALPLRRSGQVQAMVAISLWGHDAHAVQQAAATVRWGMGWLGQTPAAQADAPVVPQLQRARQALDITAGVVNEPGFSAAAMGLTEHLARAFGCTLVQLGWAEAAGVRLVVRSNTAWHDGRAVLVRLAEQAMNEALDQGQPLAWPGPAQTTDLVPRMAHAAYARAAAAPALLCVPLRAQGLLVGALLFERATPFTPDEAEAADALAALLGPLLQTRHQAEESVGAHLRRKGGALAAWAVGSRHAGWKLLGASAALLLLVAALLPVTHRVTAPAVLEGQTQRAAVAPFAGYIRSASARAGDTVKQGQLLATLDDRDLQLERQRWESEFELATRKEREALAGTDRAVLRQMAAQAAQAQAQLGLVQEKLSRLEIRAPFDGVVVKGDLSQLLGAPVETGKALFELAPLEAWRVILKVDERDIAYVRPEQAGELVLSGLSGQSYGVRVQRVLSVAEAEEGRNQFRVEAQLADAVTRLRPGMEGVAKVDVGTASLLWVGTHRLTEWMRRTAWEWAP